MKQVRIVLWLLVAVAAGVAGYMALNGTAPSENKQVTVLGGPFNLVSHKGEPLTREDLLGRPHALFSVSPIVPISARPRYCTRQAG